MGQMTTLQIATFGTDGQEGIATGIRNFPVHKLCLVCYNYDKQKAEDFSRKIQNLLGISTTISLVTKENIIRDTIETVSEILSRENKYFQQVLINVSAGDKLIGCAALSSAFIHGIKAFGMDSSGSPLLMPVLKLSYSEIVSEAKIKILRALDNAGGIVRSLEQLGEVSGYGKPLLSYHIQGARDSKGLVDLGLIEIEKKERGRISVKINTLGKLLVGSNPMNAVE